MRTETFIRNPACEEEKIAYSREIVNAGTKKRLETAATVAGPVQETLFLAGQQQGINLLQGCQLPRSGAKVDK
jgi:hypothetical protein